MNRRQFIKASIPAVVLPAIAITCKYEDDEKGPEKESKCDWPYRVYCYERGQGEWTFTENIRGSFAHQREYMTFEDEQMWPYAGWMDGGKLHFATIDDATDFVDCHVRTKDDTNLIDSIYDVYFVDPKEEKNWHPPLRRPTEIQVAHYWFNGDTGGQIHWVAPTNTLRAEVCTDWGKVEYS